MLNTCTIPPMATFPLKDATAHHLQCTLLAPFLGIRDIICSTWIDASVSFFISHLICKYYFATFKTG